MSTSWFLLYYPVFSLACIWLGWGFVRRPQTAAGYLIRSASSEKPPALIVKLLRYLFLFSSVSLIFSFFPFSLAELLFSASGLLVVFVTGRLLLQWNDIRVILPQRQASVENVIKRAGVSMLSLAVVSFLLWMHVIE